MKHILSFGLMACVGMAQTPPPTSMPGLGRGLDELKAEYAHVGVGRRLKPKQWPNGARVAGTGIAAYRFGPAMAEGFLHEFSGWVVFVTACAMMLLIHRVIVRIAPDHPLKAATAAVA